MMRIAILEASHWHVPLYLDGFANSEARIVALSDSMSMVGSELANRFEANLYSSVDELLVKEDIDFAFAFGRHSDMADIATALIESRVPFSLEKPCGLNAGEVARLLSASEDAGIYVAVPYIYRSSELLRILRDIEGGLPSDFKHLSFRFIAGRPQRYETWDCSWMLDPQQSGGGALMNLGGHFIDLFRQLTGAEVDRVSATMSAATHHRAVEDFAVVTLHAGDGLVGVIETGYTYPDTPGEQREFSFTARSSSHYLRTSDGGVFVRPVNAHAGDTRTIAFETETDLYYPIYARNIIQEWQQGQPPSVGLRDALEVMKILEAAYESAGRGGTPITIR